MPLAAAGTDLKDLRQALGTFGAVSRRRPTLLVAFAVVVPSGNEILDALLKDAEPA
jgi:hypothetical protein